MKRTAIIVIMALMSLAASARSVHYFTHSQAARTVKYLNAQNEMMIYCGYDYEIETYVLINEVWMERINSAYYEIWVYGYDAYTGEEIYMPLDLQCVWLFSGSRIYNAAQHLRFHVTVNHPTFTWHIPAYRPFVRVIHSPSYARTYHYTIHRHGWMPPAPPAPGYVAPLPPYYMRHRTEPAPLPAAAWTPGQEQPRITTPATSQPSRNARTSSTRNVTTVPTQSSTPAASSAPSTSSTRAANTRSANTATSTTSRSGNTANTAPSRSGNTTTTTTTSSSTRSNTRSASTTPTRSSSTRSSNTPTSSSSTRAASSPSRATTTPTRATNASTPSTTSARQNATNASRATNENSRNASAASSSSRNASSTRNNTATRTR